MPLSGAGSLPYVGGDQGFTPRYWFPATSIPSGTTGVVVAGRQHWLPLLAPGLLVDRIGINVTVGAAGGCRLGLYANDRGKPGKLIVDAGAVDTSAAALVEATFAALRLPNDWVWLSSIFEGAPTVSVGTGANPQVLGATSFTGVAKGLNAVQAYGAMPANAAAAPTVATASTTPLIGVRKS